MEYYRDRKLWLVNGTHMVVATLAYDIMRKQGIPEINWADQLISPYLSDPDVSKECKMFAVSQIIRLIDKYERPAEDRGRSDSQKCPFLRQRSPNHLIKRSSSFFIELSFCAFLARSGYQLTNVAYAPPHGNHPY